MRRALEALDTEVRRILAGEGSVGNVVSVRQEPSLVVVAPAFSFDRHVRPSLAAEEANANDRSNTSLLLSCDEVNYLIAARRSEAADETQN